MQRLNQRSRKSRGVSIVEFAAALVLGLPLIISILYATLECSFLFTIRSNLELAGRKAARQLAIVYGQNPAVATTRALQDNVFDDCFIKGYTANTNQFDAYFETTTTPRTVTVVVRYPKPNTSTLAPFPNPDPFHLGGNFEIKSASTFSLE